jgi:hypothetical protein
VLIKPYLEILIESCGKVITYYTPYANTSHLPRKYVAPASEYYTVFDVSAELNRHCFGRTEPMRAGYRGEERITSIRFTSFANGKHYMATPGLTQVFETTPD